MNDASSADSNTSEDLRQLAKAYHAFYEVLPYEVLIEEKGGSLSATTRKIQYGFDVDIYGVNPNTRVGKQLALPGHDPGYALASAEVLKIAKDMSRNTDPSCAIEVISFPSRIVMGDHAQVLGMLRIKISHRGSIDQPSGPLEQQVLNEIVGQLQRLGIVRR
jgi:hypothetical protein